MKPSSATLAMFSLIACLAAPDRGACADTAVDIAGSPPARVALTGAQSKTGRGVSIAVVNHSDRALRLQRPLAVERKERNGWQKVADISNLWLRADCATDEAHVVFYAALAKTCVEVAAQSSFIASDWFGTIGDAQCACERCTAAPPGTYRYVARFCESQRTLVGTPFELRR